MRKILILLVLSLTIAGYSQNDLEGTLKKFLDKYSNSYKMEKNNSIFTWTLEKKTEAIYTCKKSIKQKETYKNNYNLIVNPRIDIAVFQYVSEVKCSGAIDSLLKCFPTECGTVKINKNEKGMKIIPSIFILNKKSIIVASIACEQENPNWEKFKLDLIETFAEPKNKKIISGCNGPLKWE